MTSRERAEGIVEHFKPEPDQRLDVGFNIEVDCVEEVIQAAVNETWKTALAIAEKEFKYANEKAQMSSLEGHPDRFADGARYASQGIAQKLREQIKK